MINIKEINIAQSIIEKRKEKGITQSELAEYMGVSKASVSKWETGQSYPDITFLPQLAMYFNISIDELVGYSPQMTKEDIKKLYYRLSADFVNKPAEEVIRECREIVKKYYSCFPLLMQISILFLNHHMLLTDEEEQKEILNYAIEMLERVKKESDDLSLCVEATHILAGFYLFSRNPQKVLELLGEDIKSNLKPETAIAQAYTLLGETDRSLQVLQFASYQYLISMMGDMNLMLSLYLDNEEKMDEVVKRIVALNDIFQVEKLAPHISQQSFVVAAQIYAVQKREDRALEMLQRYADVFLNRRVEYVLHGDEFFDVIDKYFAELDLGEKAPRDVKLIKESVLGAVINEPIFSDFKGNPKFESIVYQLKNSMGEI